MKSRAVQHSTPVRILKLSRTAKSPRFWQTASFSARSPSPTKAATARLNTRSTSTGRSSASSTTEKRSPSRQLRTPLSLKATRSPEQATSTKMPTMLREVTLQSARRSAQARYQTLRPSPTRRRSLNATTTSPNPIRSPRTNKSAAKPSRSAA